MDNIQELEKIGLQKVCRETHIEEKYLRYMVKSDFDKLNYINTLGFVKILSREYNLDLSEWNESFKEYWNENRKDDDDGFVIIANDKKSTSKFLIFIFIALLAGAFYILFSIFQDKINTANYTNSKEVAYEQPPIVKEAQEALDEVNSTFVEEAEEEIFKKDINSSEDVVTQEIIEEEIIEEGTAKEKKEQIDLGSLKEAVLVPNSRLWLGVIYLDDKKKESLIGDGNFSIDLSREQIISTGHGDFSIIVDGQKKEFKTQDPIRFLVKDANITQISLGRFKELNEGKTW